uniref:Uncharacterized protein n=1 Tax=Aegilops tauschii subsp. strangulata TaxID=200361 RepID=A0A452ZIU6_AEGTS
VANLLHKSFLDFLILQVFSCLLCNFGRSSFSLAFF